MKLSRALLVAGGFAVYASTASAVVVTYLGADNNVGPGVAHPVSSAAAAAFVATVGTGPVIDFEGLTPETNPTGVSLGNGVTLTMTGNTTDPAIPAGITGQSPNALSVYYGYNTTTGGSQYLRTFGYGRVDSVFTFATGIDAFGAYFTGTDDTSSFNNTIVLTFNDGVPVSLTIPRDPSGGIEFFGFSDFGAKITSITISEIVPDGTDIFAIDDMRFHVAAAAAAGVPEPATWGLLCIGLLAAAYTARRRLALIR